MKEIGTIRLTKGEVLATDPCYDKGTWCTVLIKNVLAGNWKAYIKYSDDTSWGNRISELILVNENYDIDSIDCFEEMEGEAGVDAGLCGFFEDKPNYNRDVWNKLCDNEFTMAGDSKGYPNYGIATLDNNFKCIGAWSSSGYGDGGYPVYIASDKSGYVYAMKVVYIDDEEFEDDISDLIDEYDDFEDFGVDVERCKDILNNWINWHEGETDAEDMVDQLRSLESSGEISEAEYDYIMNNWNDLLEF